MARSALMTVMVDAVRKAAKGLTRGAILFRHALPNITPTYINALGAQGGAMVGREADHPAGAACRCHFEQRVCAIWRS